MARCPECGLPTREGIHPLCRELWEVDRITYPIQNPDYEEERYLLMQRAAARSGAIRERTEWEDCGYYGDGDEDSPPITEGIG